MSVVSTTIFALIAFNNENKNSFHFYSFISSFIWGIGIIKSYSFANCLIENGTRKCQFCAERVNIDAIVCRYCGRDLPQYEKERETNNKSGSNEFIKLIEKIAARFNKSFPSDRPTQKRETYKSSNGYYDIEFDEQNRSICPICSRGVRLKSEEIILKNFQCPKCNNVVYFNIIIEL